jgi:uncharacterized membrane protein
VASGKLGLYLSAGTIVVCISVIVLVLASSLQAGDSSTVDLSRGRGLAMLLTSVLLVVSIIILLRIRTDLRPSTGQPSTVEVQSEDALAVGEEPLASEEEEDALASLPEDEHKLYMIISDAGGEMLQMHIVSSGVFSKAKVTRLLDKLEGRGLVVRERHGMTNRVRIIK